jgi:tight adherence protein B
MLILVLVFGAVFVAVVLFASVFSDSRAKETKRTVARLESIAAPQSRAAREQDVSIRREDRLSSISWLDKALKRLDIVEPLRLLLYQAGMNWTVARLLLTAVLAACIMGSLVYLRTRASFLAFVIGCVAGTVPFFYVLQQRSSRFERVRERLPEALDLMVAAIRAGHSLSSAMGMVAKECPEPIRREFRQCYDEQNFGLELRLAFTNLAYRLPIHDIHILITAVLIQNESGGNLTEILDKVAYLIREDFRLQRQVRVHTAQGRMTGWILSLLPLILGVGLYLLNPASMSLLWKREIGRYMLYGSIGMTLTGALIIRKIVRIQV